MKIAITRLAEKGLQDREICEAFGHEAHIVSPLEAVLDLEEVERFFSAFHEGMFDAVFFTSAYPAEKIAQDMKNDIPCRIIAIGPKTAEILERFGHHPEILPEYYSRAFVPYLKDWIAEKKIGIPRAAVKNEKLIKGISDAGGIPYEFRCYSLKPTGKILDIKDADAILFTSAMSFKEALLPDISGLIRIAVGEITADVMRDAGVVPDVVGDGSLKGTLEALNRHLSN
ncbi:MAG: uroporphyrinogen-III synthase [Methanocorpusculum sp.]|jgi:uroporphyrinogen-III synthase|nr:uroporphyrinogen-III synthase [Methanocorpusculum sp.]MEE1135535.1 uroporphyrinogen-III synthase [Methanocorpusculum sp.]HJJ82651.1 uroporphyrinogen-III synthase [Methanocorpusculum sp.]